MISNTKAINYTPTDIKRSLIWMLVLNLAIAAISSGVLLIIDFFDFGSLVSGIGSSLVEGNIAVQLTYLQWFQYGWLSLLCIWIVLVGIYFVYGYWVAPHGANIQTIRVINVAATIVGIVAMTAFIFTIVTSFGFFKWFLPMKLGIMIINQLRVWAIIIIVVTSYAIIAPFISMWFSVSITPRHWYQLRTFLAWFYAGLLFLTVVSLFSISAMGLLSTKAAFLLNNTETQADDLLNQLNQLQGSVDTVSFNLVAILNSSQTLQDLVDFVAQNPGTVDAFQQTLDNVGTTVSEINTNLLYPGVLKPQPVSVASPSVWANIVSANAATGGQVQVLFAQIDTSITTLNGLIDLLQQGTASQVDLANAAGLVVSALNTVTTSVSNLSYLNYPGQIIWLGTGNTSMSGTLMNYPIYILTAVVYLWFIVPPIIFGIKWTGNSSELFTEEPIMFSMAIWTGVISVLFYLLVMQIMVPVIGISKFNIGPSYYDQFGFLLDTTVPSWTNVEIMQVNLTGDNSIEYAVFLSVLIGLVAGPVGAVGLNQQFHGKIIKNY